MLRFLFSLNIFRRLSALEKHMNAIDTAIKNYSDQVEAHFVTTKGLLTGLATGVSGLDQAIQALEAQLGNEELSPESQALLQKLVDDSDALNTQAQAIDTTIPAPPAPPTPTA